LFFHGLQAVRGFPAIREFEKGTWGEKWKTF
jgi:hypothetical protein